MAYCQIAANPMAGQQQFEQVVAHLRTTGAFPPDGQRLLIAGPAEPGWRVITVWDTQESLEQFNGGRLADALREANVAVDLMRSTIFEVHTIVAGDLVGAPR
jgi:hypothetical protein